MLGLECSLWRESWPADVGGGLPSLRRKTAWETELQAVKSWERSQLLLANRMHSWGSSSGNTQFRWLWRHRCRSRLQKWKLQGEKWTKNRNTKYSGMLLVKWYCLSRVKYAPRGIQALALQSEIQKRSAFARLKYLIPVRLLIFTLLTQFLHVRQ